MKLNENSRPLHTLQNYCKIIVILKKPESLSKVNKDVLLYFLHHFVK